MTRTAWLLGIVLTGLPMAGGAAGSDAFLVKDINQTPVIYSSTPRQFAVIDNTAFFAADTPSGSALWRSDGTAAGTQLVKTVGIVGSPVRVHGTLFFAGWNETGLELWKSDGTAAGTTLVKDINPGPGSALDSSEFVNGLTAVGELVFFVATDGVHGRGLWRSDGTADGTILLKDAFATWLAAANGVLLFAADESRTDYELWRSDGTVDGTVRVKDIKPGPAGSDPLLFATVDATIYFRANDGVHGEELWKTDTTEAGTAMVADINPGPGGSFPDQLTAVGDRLFFYAGADGISLGDLWTSDGTAAGTTRVAPAAILRSGQLFSFDGTVLFAQGDADTGLELWRSDGTTGGTFLLKDINPGRADSFPSSLKLADGLVFFTADDGTHGAELWRSDGTSQGTTLVRDINPGPAPAAAGSFDSLVAVGDTVLLAADDGVHGYELWKSDGSSAGTTLVKDIWPGPATADASPALLTPLGESLIFVADDRIAGLSLWRSDGTEVGTTRVADLKDIDAGTPPFSSTCTLAKLGGKLYFGADDRIAGNELWSSDGTSAGTVLIKDIWPGSSGAAPGELRVVGHQLYFAAEDGTHGRELWKSDGTRSGTVLVKDIVAGLGSSSPTQLTAVRDKLFFVAGSDSATELWVSNGTAAGTIHLQDSFYATNLTAVGGTLYFTSGYSVWKSDGTAAGTVMVGDFHPVSGSYQPNQLRAVGDRLFFYAKEPGGSFIKLWSIGGEDYNPLTELDQLEPRDFISAAGQVFFSADDAEHGRELWASDGTEAGTRLVRDIHPGAIGSNPGGFSPTPGALLFTACDADACRLWSSDGTEAGTQPLAGFGSAAPSASTCRAHTGLPTNLFVAAGALAYFVGDDFTYGVELRAAPLSSANCTGDCDGDGAVTINELVSMVRLALGAPGDSCQTATSPTITVLITAVNRALYGCV